MLQKFVCIISGDNPIHMFGDSKSPGAVASLESIGNLGTDENKIIIQALSVFIEKELGIVPKRSVHYLFLLFHASREQGKKHATIFDHVGDDLHQQLTRCKKIL